MNQINIVLYEPEIASNTGNIARSCVGFNATLHLIRPYGFFLNDKNLLRSSTNHWEKLIFYEYNSFDEFIEENNPENLFIYTRFGENSPNKFNYEKLNKIYFLFGKESSGIPSEILKKYKTNLIRIPSSKNIVSLNLANTVAIALYEVNRQLNFNNLSMKKPHKKI